VISADSNASKAAPTARITLGAAITWLLFSFITLTIGTMALPRAGRLYDFRAFYTAGWLLLHHPTQLFNLSVQTSTQNAVVCTMDRGVPFYHPAYEALLFAPLSLLSYRPAYILFGTVNLLLLALCYVLAPRAADTRIARIPRPLLFFFCFPIFMAIAEGQDSIVFLLLICLLWRALANKNDRAAGILLALALFKLQIAFALLFFLAIHLPAPRRARLLFSFAPAAVAVALVCLLITGPHGIADWFRLVGSASVASHLDHHTQAVIAVYPKAMPTINGLLYVLGGHLLAPRASLGLDLVLSALVFVVTLFLSRTTRQLPAAFCAALAAALLLSPHLYLYDYVLLLFPVLLLTERSQPILTALFYIVPFILFAVSGIDWFAIMALLPGLFLTSQLLGDRSLRPHQTTPENVTPHHLTALE
jgi:hypothetical protein